jgi:hypothetical protein
VRLAAGMPADMAADTAAEAAPVVVDMDKLLVMPAVGAGTAAAATTATPAAVAAGNMAAGWEAP